MRVEHCRQVCGGELRLWLHFLVHSATLPEQGGCRRGRTHSPVGSQHQDTRGCLRSSTLIQDGALRREEPEKPGSQSTQGSGERGGVGFP